MSQSNVPGFRLSPQQRYLWSLQNVSGSPFQVLSTVSIKGELRTDILQQALTEVIKRHEILRTTFHRPPGIKTPFQVISPKPELSLESYDLSDLNQEALLIELDSRFVAEQRRSFDFACEPPVRASLYKISHEHHALLISLPALCGDPLTILNLMNDVGTAYGLTLNGGNFAQEPMQYADFAEWHNELLQSSDEHAEGGRNYWRELNGSEVWPLSLPLERRTTAEQTFQTEVISIDLDSTCVTNVEALVREYGTSTEVVLFAWWQVLIWRLTNRSDFVIFKLFDGRKLEDLQTAFGAYATYLPVACRNENVSFASHLRTCSTALSRAEEWQEYFDPNDFYERAGDSVAFDFTECDSAIKHSGLEFSLLRQEIHLGPSKLRLSCFKSEDSIRVELFYGLQSFERETAEAYASYFKRLVAESSVIKAGSSRVGEIQILGETERTRLLVNINATTSEFSAASCIHELFEKQVTRTPDAPALVCENVELTYANLNARANRLAHLLLRRGLVSNACVGICTDRSAEAIIALMGILKAGGAYVPLNPEHPTARLASQLAQSNVSILITNGSASDLLVGFSGEIIDLDRDRSLLAAEPDVNPPSVNGSGSVAYVIYTSGSSGMPKGVAINHQGLVNYTQSILRRLHVKEPLHFATVSTITADLGNTCIFPALVSGGCLHVISHDVAMEGTLLSQYVAKRPIDVLKIVPSHLSALLATEGHRDILPRKYLILGGEAFSWELLDGISKTNPACEIINHYGPTETTVGSLTLSLKQQKLSTRSLTVPIGQPIANTRVYILDSHMNLTPTGVAGELYIGGLGLAIGYLNQPMETATRFVPDPFSGEPGTRLYRTGDLTRYLPDGNIEFLGRMDHQVKVRGFRVELAEIEAVLLTHSQVRQAVVIAQPSTTESHRLLGYVVASGNKPPGVDELRSFLGQHVPDYMIPSTFVFLKTMPLTSNGKIDRESLPDPNDARPDLQRIFVAPRTPVERKMADIWAESLKLKEVGVLDNFFELGGHSLLATQVVSRMRKAFNCEIPLRSLFASPTIQQLAEEIGDSMAIDTERLLSDIEKLSDEEVENLLKTRQL